MGAGSGAPVSETRWGCVHGSSEGPSLKRTAGLQDSTPDRRGSEGSWVGGSHLLLGPLDPPRKDLLLSLDAVACHKAAFLLLPCPSHLSSWPFNKTAPSVNTVLQRGSQAVCWGSWHRPPSSWEDVPWLGGGRG